VLEEVEQRVVGPVEVFDDEHARVGRGHLLEVSPPRGERLLAARGDAVALRADERGEARLQPFRLVRVLERPGDTLGELAARGGSVVRLENPRFSLHDLPECPEGDAFAVREAASVPPRDEIGTLVESCAELRGKTTLPDTGLPNDRHQLH
jgi:hypothetical protein